MLINTVAALLGVSAGLMFGSRATGPHRWMLTLAPLLVVAAGFIGAFAVLPSAPWAGSIFGMSSFITTVLASAAVRRQEPVFVAEPYWRRALMVLSGRYPTTSALPEEEELAGR
ncbi:hypothetical protein [Microbacterium saperdae]|uniref:Uncharacterized protein n=1 Tax=Microbacterium saperdae TaxID=69368 RepID=A0A543BB72_9MICO|nr:hypothetical protein [Microbacterium saperdae]TQL82090.1 hypothetical protein FB560_3572 [Microbacterium saperdae]GGM37142.1 hypothetical protein GCM10010489_05090 [Microbacterium saperdae]